MNKTDLINAVAEKSGLSKKDATSAVNAIFSTVPREGIIATEVAKGKRVQLTGFGTFERRNRKKRKARNPQTGAEIMIPATKYPAFSAGKSLKERVSSK
ncbi:HU family DNA-binding protein [bacterium]|nr:HU family DNA-binding protein [bacterium]MBU1675099.1 HU family DNA-binding protein [bacterium]